MMALAEAKETRTRYLDICVICHEEVLIPVRFSCFPCSTDLDSRNSCNTFTVVCKLCADQYLELEKDENDRLIQDFRPKRCLFCPSLSISNSYSIQFLLMKVDKNERHCPFQKEGCDMKGTHFNVFEHIEKGCKYRKIRCGHCGESYIKNEQKEHRASCPYFYHCDFCNDYLLHRQKYNHLKKDHDAVWCFCCEKWIFTDGNDDMDKKHRLLHHWNHSCTPFFSCNFCKKRISPVHCIEHYQEHFDEISVLSKNMSQCKNTFTSFSLENDKRRMTRWFEKETRYWNATNLLLKKIIFFEDL